MVAKRIIFIGRVQGVGFRFTAHRIAERYQLTGFVRNLYDGTVEVLAQGQADDIAHCIKELQDCFAGYLRETQIEEITHDPTYTDFRITF